VLSGTTVVTTDRDERLEKLGKSDDCGHSLVFDNAKRLKNQGSATWHRKQGIGVASESVETPKKPQKTVVKHP
jgi:hypothetical protein